MSAMRPGEGVYSWLTSMADEPHALWQSLHQLLIYQASDSNAVIHSVHDYDAVKASLTAFLDKLGACPDSRLNNVGQRLKLAP